jgi:glycosidase
MIKKTTSIILSLLFSVAAFCGCGGNGNTNGDDNGDPYIYGEVTHVDDNNRVFYEIFVRSFADSNGDGIGDLRGVIEKLDYLNDGNDNTHNDLGVTGIWLMPICPSPTYHKYDVTDYYAIDPEYGTMADFEELADKCEERGIKLIVDLVLNHTSSQHPWFIQSKSAQVSGGNSPYKDWYVYADSKVTDKYYKIADKLYYEGDFWSEMPDLNMQSESLRHEVKKIVDFWLEKGADGFRLDAAKHVYSNMEDNISFWKWFTDYVKAKKENAYTVAEIWSTGGEIQEYYRAGFTSVFNYEGGDALGKIVNTVNSGAGLSSPAKFAQWVEEWQGKIVAKNAGAIDAPFLSNHDNGRSFGALRRDASNAKMAALLYLTMPGSPFIYYGEEIGMLGSGIDENKRLGMLWNSSSGNCSDPPKANWFEQTCEPVSKQKEDYNSMLHLYRMAIRMRAENPELARGTVQAIDVGLSDVAAWKATWNGKSVVVVHNLSFVRAEATFPLSGATLRSYVAVEGGKPTVNGGNVTVPGYCTAVFAV